MKLFAAGGAFVTGFLPETDHSLSCHRPRAAGKYQTGAAILEQQPTIYKLNELGRLSLFLAIVRPGISE
jgi:hypothetical protein